MQYSKYSTLFINLIDLFMCFSLSAILLALRNNAWNSKQGFMSMWPYLSNNMGYTYFYGRWINWGEIFIIIVDKA